MLTGAVGATSVLMTVGSRPALGQNCMSFLTWQSVQAGSSHQHECVGALGTGYSPDDWINTATWPSPYTAS